MVLHIGYYLIVYHQNHHFVNNNNNNIELLIDVNTSNSIYSYHIFNNIYLFIFNQDINQFVIGIDGFKYLGIINKRKSPPSPDAQIIAAAQPPPSKKPKLPYIYQRDKK